MGQFQKGNPGRPKGAKNKRKLVKVSDLLLEKNINPVDEILKLIPGMEPEHQVKAWLDLLSYCEAKPKALEIDENDDSEIPGEDEVSNADLIKLVKAPSGAS